MTDLDAKPGAGTDGGSDGAAAADAVARGQQPPLVIQAQYVKDLSFEAPGVPAIFAQLQQAKPDMRLQVDVQTRALAEKIHEVMLHIRGDCKAGDNVAFVVELSYGGVFSINVPPEHVNPMLLIECPRLLFPFARQIIASATIDGGFLPLMLGPIDFVALYQRQLEERRQQQHQDETKVV